MNIWVAVVLGLIITVLLGLVFFLSQNLRNTRHQKRIFQAKSEHLEEQLARAQRFEAVGIMAGSIVHNLNNLMSVILGHTRMVAHDLAASSPSQNDLRHVIKAGHMAADLLNEISDFNRQAEQDLKPTDLSSLLRNTLKFIRDIVPSSIVINEKIPERCEPVMASATGVQQVLMNLISNSVQAIGQSPGKIEVILKPCVIKQWQPASPQKLGPGSYIKLTVRDNGQGMEPDTLDRIIGSYFSSPPDSTRLGLGLNTVFRILDQHDGVTIPTSKAGQGTSFDIYFPKIAWQVVSEPEVKGEETLFAQEMASPTRLIPKTTVGAGDKSSETKLGREIATVLLVDDEEMVARVTTLGLQKLGYRVIKHLDSRRALADFLQTPKVFDVVVTDQIMPHMSGVSLARKIHSSRPNIPVILMTGFRDSFNETQALEAGISQVVLKPTSHRDLAEIIERNLLRQKKGQS